MFLLALFGTLIILLPRFDVCVDGEIQGKFSKDGKITGGVFIGIGVVGVILSYVLSRRRETSTAPMPLKALIGIVGVFMIGMGVYVIVTKHKACVKGLTSRSEIHLARSEVAFMTIGLFMLLGSVAFGSLVKCNATYRKVL